MEHTLEQLAKTHITQIITRAIELEPKERALIIFDTDAPLTRIITEAYRQALPKAQFVDFATVTTGDIFALFDELNQGDLVVLIQSSNFRLDDFRVRIELFQRGFKTIEHTHLNRIPETQFATYIEALAYDPTYYRPLGKALKNGIENAQRIRVVCDGTELCYDGGMEEAKLNVGDYREMKNVGGTFPIGEVFTEPKDLRAVNGTAKIFAFAGEDHLVRTYEPFLVHVTNGVLTAPEGPEAFQSVLKLIGDEEEVLVREFGMGLNPVMGPDALVNDITAFERQRGLHLSLGEKHAIYAKPGLHRKKGRYHVDIFVAVTQIFFDDQLVFADGTYDNVIKKSS
jgi:hypothetical protein